MLSRLVASVLVVLAAASGPALACKGPSLIFTDDFKTADPAWQVGSWTTLTIAGGKLQMKSDPGSYSMATYQGFFLDSGDVCVDVTMPDVMIGDWRCRIHVGGVSSDFYAFSCA